MVNTMKTLSNAVIINGVSYTINATEAKKIAQLLGLTQTKAPKQSKTETTPKTTKTVTTKTEPKKSTRVVGSIEQDGAFVRTVKGAFISSKARYAIKMSATEMGATKLSKGNKTYEFLAKQDKYVQVYQFKTVEDATKFMNEQEKRLAK